MCRQKIGSCDKRGKMYYLPLADFAGKITSVTPYSLDIDTYQQMAWLGVVIFEIEGIYFRGLSPISVVFRFPEVNLRTYVQHKGKPGVFFLSLDVGNWASLTISKRWYHLLYCKAKISYRKEGYTFHCQSVRNGNSHNPITFKGSFTTDLRSYFPEEGTIDHWLTERYCLYSLDRRGNIYCGDIHHSHGLLQKLPPTSVTIHFQHRLGLTSAKMSRFFFFQKGLDALFWNIKKIEETLSENNIYIHRIITFKYAYLTE